MNRKFKTIVSSLCVCALLTVPVVNTAFAAQHSTQGIVYSTFNAKAYEQMTEKELVQKMRDLGLNEQEIKHILELEKQRISKGNQFPSSNSIGIMKFPSNPKEGDRHTEQYRIYFSTANILAGGAAEVVVVLTAGGVPAIVAVAIAAAIANNILEGMNVRGVLVSVEYYYGPDNHGGMGWTPGYHTYSYIY
ncbi:hypothetical protein [Clostridium minihomine]|uniref:hypothetical protein n=1 Tax=Clostridium minihomine TaxID=2045012 RepID=UPI000C790A0E|nr:hypothetical protein [Clostridium minihomine]